MRALSGVAAETFGRMLEDIEKKSFGFASAVDLPECGAGEVVGLGFAFGAVGDAGKNVGDTGVIAQSGEGLAEYEQADGIVGIVGQIPTRQSSGVLESAGAESFAENVGVGLNEVQDQAPGTEEERQSNDDQAADFAP